MSAEIIHRQDSFYKIEIESVVFKLCPVLFPGFIKVVIFQVELWLLIRAEEEITLRYVLCKMEENLKIKLFKDFCSIVGQTPISFGTPGMYKYALRHIYTIALFAISTDSSQPGIIHSVPKSHPVSN